MFKSDKTYYLMYSDGKAIDHANKVRYSKGATSFVPWTEDPYSPILSTAPIVTGHHVVFAKNGIN